MQTPYRHILLVSLPIVLVGCDGRVPTQPTSPAPAQATPGPSPITGEAFEVTGIVTDEVGAPIPGAMVTMAHWLGGVVQWPSVVTDGSGFYRSRFTASPLGNGYVARAQVVSAGYEEYWRSLVRTAGSTTFVANVRLARLVRISAGESIVLSVPPDAGDCRGWVAEVCPIVHVTVTQTGTLTIDVDSRDAGGAKPPVEVCCIEGDERYGNPITVPVKAGVDLEVKVGLRPGFTTVQSFLVRTAYGTF